MKIEDGWERRDWPGNSMTFRIWSDKDNYKDYDVELFYASEKE